MAKNSAFYAIEVYATGVLISP